MADPVTAYIAITAASYLISRALTPDPPDVEGARIRDLRVQGSVYGGPIPVIFGRTRIAGNVIWADQITEYRNVETVSSKGGPSNEVTAYSYTASFAIALCQGEMAGIRRIWANSKLIYDVSDSATLSAVIQSKKIDLTFYPGNETQEPDPLIEALEGVDCAPAYKGVCYVVVQDFPLGSSPQMPNLEFEILENPSEAAQKNWSTSLGSSTYPYNSYLCSHGIGVLNAFYAGEGLQAAGPLGELDFGDFYEISTRDINDGSVVELQKFEFIDPGNDLDTSAVAGGSATTSILGIQPYSCSPDGRWTISYTEAQAALALFSYGNFASFLHPDISKPFAWMIQESERIGWGKNIWYDPDGRWVFMGVYKAENNTVYDTLYQWPLNERAHEDPLQLPHNIVEDIGGSGEGFHVYLSRDKQELSDGDTEYALYVLTISGELQIYNAATLELLDTENMTVGSVDGFAVENDIVWIVQSGASNSEIVRRELDDTFIDTFTLTGAADPGDALVRIMPERDYAILQVAHTVYAVTYGRITDGAVDLDDAVATILETAGIDDYDLTDLSGEVLDGLADTRVQSGRSILDNLRRAYNFDLIESDWQLKAVSRGGSVAVSIPETDLGAGNESAGELIEITRQQDSELPKEVVITYIASGSNYQQNTQRAQRVNPNTTRIVKIDLAMILTDARAKQIAESLLYEAWHSRERYKLSIPPEYVEYEPADVISVVHGDNTYTMRIESMGYGPAGAIAIEAARESSRLYNFDYSGASSEFPDDTMEGEGGPTLLHLLDIPTLQDGDDGSAYYLAMSGLLSNWRGGSVEYSNDGGSTWSLLTRAAFDTKYGFSDGVLASGPTNIWDRGNTLTVRTPDTLTSATELAVLNGANAALLGVHGRWEVIQFADALDNADGTWDLSMLLRGRQGTEHNTANHADGDTFILLESPESFSGLEVLDVERNWRVTTYGNTVSDARYYPLTIDGVALMPLSPVHAEAVRDSGDITISWTRRSRLRGAWSLSRSSPLGETTESYEVDIKDGDTVLRTLTSTTESVVYTEAQQNADFDSFLGMDVCIYQMSESVGRGIALDANFSFPALTYQALLVEQGADNYWPLDETAGTDCADAIGAIDLTYSGSPTLGETSLLDDGGTSVEFNGVDQYAETDTAAKNSYPFSMSGIVNIPASPTSTALALISLTDKNASNRIFSLYVDQATGTARAYARNGATPEIAIGTTNLKGSSAHIAAVYASETDRRVYVNGVEEGDSTVSVTVSSLDRTSIGRFGDSSPGAYYEGTADAVAFCREEWTAEQILAQAVKAGYA